MMRVGFAGLGIMGSRMALNLVRAGFDVRVWDKDRPNVDALVEAGAQPAPDPASLVRGRDVVVSILWDDAVAEAVVLAQMIPNADAGTTFVEMTTISPQMQRRLADAARARGCRFLDAPVTGSKDAAERGELTALVGGEANDIERVRPVLAAMTASIQHVGPNGASATLKLGNNQIIGLIAGALRESLAMCESAGIDRRVAIDMYCGTFGRVAAMKRETMIARDWTPHFTTDALLKDLHAAARAAEAAHIEVPLLHALIPTLEAAVRDGGGRLDFSSLTDSAATPVTAGRA